MPNKTYGLIVRAWTTTESLRVIVIVSYTFTTAPESNITLHPAEVEIEVRNMVCITTFQVVYIQEWGKLDTSVTWLTQSLRWVERP
jgi:hypothetical protein